MSLRCNDLMHVKLTSTKRLFDIWQETSCRRIADEQTLLKIRLPDVNITSNRLVGYTQNELQ